MKFRGNQFSRIRPAQIFRGNLFSQKWPKPAKTAKINSLKVFKSMINEGVFPDDWKKSNVVPINKKESKNLIKNYRTVSLLPIFRKTFERLVFNTLFNFFLKNKLFTPCQSRFYNYYQSHMKFIKMWIITHRYKGHFP